LQFNSQVGLTRKDRRSINYSGSGDFDRNRVACASESKQVQNQVWRFVGPKGYQVCETVESKDTTKLSFEKNTKYLARMISFPDSRTDPLPKHGTYGTTAFLDAPNKYRQ